MLPASNAGVGMSVGFPDPCLTPTPAGPVPIPYPNLGLNATSLAFVPNVFVSGVPGSNMATKPAMTSGMEAGAAHPLFKMPGGYTMGMPNVLVGGLPGITVAMPTNGNMFNNPLGVVAVPSAVNVLYNCRCDADHGPAAQLRAAGNGLLRVGARARGGNCRAVQIGLFTRRLPDALAGLLAGTDPDLPVELDLRDCRGGELGAALRLAALFVERGADLLHVPAGRLVATSTGRFAGRRVNLRVNAGTASAAETFAAALQRNGARVVGAPTYGKADVTDARGRHRLSLAGTQVCPA